MDELVGSSGYRLIGKGSINGKKLADTPYPAVVKTDTVERVSGELIELTPFAAAISKLDQYEGFDPHNSVGSLYIREQVHVALEDGQVAEAWVYYYNG